MKWRGRRQSQNVEDRRGRSSGRKVAVGGGLGAIIILILSLVTGTDLSGLLQFIESPTIETTEPKRESLPDDETAQMVSTVLASTEDIWDHLFQEQGRTYQKPNLVMFDYATSSACGQASSAMGPFYCPGDNKVYIDLSFCQDLKTRFQAPGDFAVAYVIAHEVGHHVQNLLGISQQVQSMRQQMSTVEYNKLSVKMELQADFLAGIWGYYAENMQDLLDKNDLEEALQAAYAIGDDRIQKQTQGYVVPDAFTHGSSQQRMYWFKRGFDTGDLSLGEFNKIQ
ncbi:KPN_02809 family neutral zinc metallopeptidase [Membranihabitans maritimus]|uniref:KPN_02809 family neutral zinc metallopeptidase n=1 Tax=Membranihabitans maritimus TaxID=2904244 RepID=UPI001F3AE556|nr:neutral zinc metallopeptidase [Membranihabitans maritimus]